MIIAQRTYKHKVLLLMKVGLACFLVVIFLAQNAQTGFFEAQNFAYKKLNANETQYFLANLNSLPAAGESGEPAENLGIDLAAISNQIAEQIKTAVEPLLLKEAGEIKLNTPLFTEHRGLNNLLYYSTLIAVFSLILIEAQKIIFKTNQSFRLKQILNKISPRSPNFN